jgi:hypothetical protein
MIEFENMLHPAKAQYLRLAYDTNPSQIAHLFTKQWRLQLPNLVCRSKTEIQKRFICVFFRLSVFMVVYKILSYNLAFVRYLNVDF